MNPPLQHRWSWVFRGLVLASGLGLGSLLLLASALQPSPRGYGTHGQLGLGRCYFVEQWEIRCPSCGMTTSWSLLLRGRLLAAIRANAGGVILAIAALVAAPWLLISAALGRWIVRSPNEFELFLFLLGWLAVTLANWGFRYHDI